MNRLSLISSAISNSTSTSYTKIIVEKKDGVGIIWFNSPKDLNALSVEMAKNIKQALLELDQDRTVKIATIRSKHDKIFCAGADIKHMLTGDYANFPNNMHFRGVMRAFRSFRKPIIAIVEGKALGGGFQLALLCDIIIASEKASFGLPEINLGLYPGMGGTQILTRIVGTKVAMRMILTGQPISSQEAQRLNIAHLFPGNDFEASLNNFQQTLLNKASESMNSAKRSINFALQTTLEQGIQHEASIFQSLFYQQGPRQGITAFVEKRKPNFRDI